MAIDLGRVHVTLGANPAFGDGVIFLKAKDGTEYEASFDADYAWSLEKDMRKIRKVASDFPDYTGDEREGGPTPSLLSKFFNLFRG